MLAVRASRAARCGALRRAALARSVHDTSPPAAGKEQDVSEEILMPTEDARPVFHF